MELLFKIGKKLQKLEAMKRGKAVNPCIKNIEVVCDFRSLLGPFSGINAPLICLIQTIERIFTKKCMEK